MSGCILGWCPVCDEDKLIKQNEAHIRLKKDSQDDKVIRYK